MYLENSKSTSTSASSANLFSLVAIVNASRFVNSAINNAPSCTVGHIIGGSFAKVAKSAFSFAIVGSKGCIERFTAGLTSLGEALEAARVEVGRVVKGLAGGGHGHNEKSDGL